MARIFQLIILIAFLSVPLSACSESAETAPQEEKAEAVAADNYERQPLKIQTQDGRELLFEVEVADTPQESAKGLMYRKHMEPDHGMIFLFPMAQPLSFWMRNTYLPLDIVFISSQGIILNIEKGKPLNEQNVYSAGPAQYVLEINQGTSKKLGISAGDKVIFSGFM